MENHTPQKKDKKKRQMVVSIRNPVHPSIDMALKISILNVTFGSQICASDVDRRITRSQISRNQKIGKRKFTGSPKDLKLMHTDQ